MNNIDNVKEKFKNSGYIVVKDVLSTEMCFFLSRFLFVKAHQNKLLNNNPNDVDRQVPGSICHLGHESVFDTVSEIIWPKIEAITGLELLPTYSYSRLLKNGNELEKHKDRPSCEISITIQLGRSHHYSWPIYMGGNRVDLAEGSGVIYKGCDIEHWREPCDGPKGYYSGQLFCHYVQANGKHKKYAGDRRYPGEKIPFKKHRTFLMENK